MLRRKLEVNRVLLKRDYSEHLVNKFIVSIDYAMGIAVDFGKDSVFKVQINQRLNISATHHPLYLTYS